MLKIKSEHARKSSLSGRYAQEVIEKYKDQVQGVVYRFGRKMAREPFRWLSQKVTSRWLSLSKIKHFRGDIVFLYVRNSSLEILYLKRMNFELGIVKYKSLQDCDIIIKSCFPSIFNSCDWYWTSDLYIAVSKMVPVYNQCFGFVPLLGIRVF